jgi:c-di-GMP-binding flagellar brake protein YcgR
MQTQTRGSADRQFSADRRHPRFLLSSPLAVRRTLRSGSQVTRGLTLEISQGGLSAVLCGPPPVGERVSLKLHLQNSTFQARAIVRHSAPSRTGFEFLELRPHAQRRIQKCLQNSALCPCPQGMQIQVM